MLYRELYGKLLANVKKETLLRTCSAHALHKKKQVSEVFWYHYSEKFVILNSFHIFFICFFMNIFTQRK